MSRIRKHLSATNDTNFEDIIKLQLHKPKKWNWELSTSRSSPHIPLPVIQLFDDKKKLLIETKRNDRRTWHESDSKRFSKYYTIPEQVSIFTKFSQFECENDYKPKKQHSYTSSDQNKLNTEDKIRIKEHLLRKSQSVIYSKAPRNKASNIPYLKDDENYTCISNNTAMKKCYKTNDAIQNNFSKEKYTDSDDKRYSLVSSNAGTLLVKEDCKRSEKRRRRKISEHKKAARNSSETCDLANKKNTGKLANVMKVLNSGESRNGVQVSDIYAKDVKPHVQHADVRDDRENANDDKRSDIKDAEIGIRGDAVAGTDELSMGANFSRHSSKGLSGRRCQSISNICNSKDHFLDPSGREVDAAYKFCNSMPSPNGTAYNNNYEHRPLSKKSSLQHTVSEHVIDPEHQPLQWKFTDTHTLCDQGYGSERSPEEEIPPPLPDHEYDCEHMLDCCYSSYPFITTENTFEVELVKGSRGLGLSVCGGIDSDGSWPGLLRIKRLFPHQPAASCGVLSVGDLLLESNGISLTGLSNYEALEVLRMTPNKVVLLVCRPPAEVLSTMSPVSDVPPPPPRRASSPPHAAPKLPDDNYDSEFEIILTKIHGSLGFTLCKEEEGIIGHYVRALVREPAISDGRIQPGDKIVAVNGVEITSMSHEQAVQFLRQCDNEVHLRLYREIDKASTDLSPTDITPNSSFRPKINLRQEAVDMLSDLAARKLCSSSPCTSPRHLKDDACTNNCETARTEDDDKVVRPCFLDLYNPNQTPVAVRKSKFNLSLAHNAYELNNLDPEMLDAPNLNCAVYNNADASTSNDNDLPDEPVSMPPLSCTKNSNFSYKKPTYQSAHPQVEFTSNNKSDTDTSVPEKHDSKDEDLVVNDAHILNIELNRGWNSRLGFSLQEVDGCTCVSAVYSDSVAAKDGRLKRGDCLLRVNDEMVEHMKTSEVIDLLRIIRGPVCITVLRRKSRLE